MAGPPDWLLAIVGHEPLQQRRGLDCVELFSGQGELHKAFARAGYRARGFDVRQHPDEDICRLAGLRAAAALVRRLRPGGLLWLAPPCSSWVWISSSWHKRTPQQPWGRSGIPEIRDANSTAVAVGALMRLGASRGAQVFLEQPKDSVMHHCPPIAKAIAMTGCASVVTHLGAFGGPIPKPLRLWSNCRLLGSLRRDLPRGLWHGGSAPAGGDCAQQGGSAPATPWRQQGGSAPATSRRSHPYYTVDVCGAVTGRPALAETAAYAVQFGETVAGNYTRSLPRILEQLQRQDGCRALAPHEDPDEGDASAVECLCLSL